MIKLKMIIRMLALLILPSSLLRGFNSILGIKVGVKARIGFSIIFCDRFILSEGARLGHFNYIKINDVFLAKKAYILHFNRFTGPLHIRLSALAGIGNFNTFVKAPISVKNTISKVYLGKLSKITSRHYIDCMCNLTILSYSTIAGIRSQIWTHGYYHYRGVHKRVRIDGSIKIGRYCYIGSGSIFNPGITICDSVNIGSNSSISKTISEEGFYVSQRLRKIEKDPDFDARLEILDSNVTSEVTYVKNI
jgi:acetyltransferase-like isoleucine patch superfamily enzyme